ncbi:hypothetical protein MPS_1258 [Mycobacterium pseudoshottsii JCM 15466]|nr:hypothetical protein MMSP_2663 [Mycobacterium sp. 012931]GAQ32878.1 hypothetical protein MPS_1258 [Mycobacterium pseudoshottsii JCM 15466]
MLSSLCSELVSGWNPTLTGRPHISAIPETDTSAAAKVVT